MKIKKKFFWVILFTIVTGSIWSLDRLAGSISGIQPAMSEKNRFLQETAPLITSTNHLLPNLEDRFINEQRTDGKARVLRTNEYGLVIGQPVDTTTPESHYILFLGGSTTENNEVDEEYRFPFFAPERLSKESSTPFVGVNAGVRGHTTQDSTNLYLNHPDPKISRSKIVVIMHNINDRLRLRLNGDYKSSITNPSPLSNEGVGEAIYETLASVWKWLCTHSNILTLLDITISKHLVAKSEIIVDERIIDTLSPLGESHLMQFKQNYMNLIALVKANNQTPVLMTQPLGKPSEEQDRFNQRIRDLAKEQSIDLIDLAAEGKKHPNQHALFYDDFIHFNNAGSKWASEIIAYELARLLKLQGKLTVDKFGCKEIYAGKATIVNAPLKENLLSGRYPSFNQSETKILFQSNSERGSSINLLDTRSGEITVLISEKNPDGLEHPTWKNDGNIVFTRKQGKKRTLYQLNIATRSEMKLVNQDETDLQAAIANVPNNHAVYFAGYTDKAGLLSRSSIYQFDPNVGKPIRLINNEEELWRPFVTRNGRMFFIAYIQGRYQIVESDGTSYKQVIPTDHEQWDPAVSDDNRLIAYTERRNGDFDIWIADLSTKDLTPKRITKSVEDEWDPRFSPSGNYLLYAGTSPYGDQIRAVCLK